MKILIIDDELLVRIGIKTILEELRLQLSVCSAENGLEAVRLFENDVPDLVFVDINMPRMNGFDFLRVMRHKYPDTMFVIVTCYNDVESVHTAMRLGISHYIVKTDLDRGKIEQLVWACAGKIHENLQPAGSGGMSHDTAEKNIDLLSAEQISRAAGGELCGSNAIVIYAVSKNRAHIKHERRRILLDLLGGIVSDYGNGKIYFTTGNGIVILAELPSRCYEPDVIRLLTTELCQQIVDSMKTYFNEAYFAGGTQCDEKTDIAGAVRRAKSYTQLSYYNRDCAVYCFCNNQNILKKEIGENYRETLRNALDYERLDEALRILERYEGEMKAKRPANVDYVMTLSFDLFYLILQHYQSRAARDGSERAPDFDYRKLLSDISDLHAVLWQARALIHGLEAREEEKKREKSNDSIIRHAKEYIEAHLGDDLALQSVARDVGVSSSHFTRLFKESTGVTFIDYCILRRIERAKKYIDRGDKIQLVAEKVGYQNYSYFSKLFKRMTGMSPIEYKNQKNS